MLCDHLAQIQLVIDDENFGRDGMSWPPDGRGLHDGAAACRCLNPGVILSPVSAEVNILLPPFHYAAFVESRCFSAMSRSLPLCFNCFSPWAGAARDC